MKSARTLTEAAGSQAVREALPPYFAVSVTKFVVLWFCSFGLYGLYWFYKQWKVVKARERINIHPPLRAVFPIFFCHALFKHINATARAYEIEGALPAGPLAAGFIVLTLLWPLPGPYSLVTFLSIAFLVPAQGLINKINSQLNPHASPNARFTGANIALAVVGGLMLILAFIGAFFPQP